MSHIMNENRDVFSDIAKERARQEKLKAAGKFKWTCADNVQMALKLTVLAEEFGEVAKEVCEGYQDKASINRLRTELVQVAAVCVAWVESLDNLEWVEVSGE